MASGTYHSSHLYAEYPNKLLQVYNTKSIGMGTSACGYKVRTIARIDAADCIVTPIDFCALADNYLVHIWLYKLHNTVNADRATANFINKDVGRMHVL